MAADLVAVQKEITVAGVSHMHTYWMKAEDAQKEHDAGTGKKTGETKKFNQLEPHEKSTYWKQAAAKAAATKAGPKAKAPEATTPPSAKDPDAEFAKAHKDWVAGGGFGPKPEIGHFLPSSSGETASKEAKLSPDESAIKSAVESSVAAHGDKFHAGEFFQGLTIQGQTALGTAPIEKINEWAKAAKPQPSEQAKKWMSAGQKAAATKKAKAEAAKAAAKAAEPPMSKGDAALRKMAAARADSSKEIDAAAEAKAAAKASVQAKVAVAVKKFGKFGFNNAKFMSGLTDEEKGSISLGELKGMVYDQTKKSKATSTTASKPASSTPTSKSTATLPMVKNAISHDMTDEERAAVRKSALPPPPGGFKNAMKAAGAEEHEAEKMKETVDSWSGSSSSGPAMRIRGAAITAMLPNDPEKAKAVLEELRDHPNAAGHSYAGTAQKQKMEEGFSDPKVVATVVASAKVAQSMYDEEYITVYRGVSGGLATKVKNAAKESGSTEVDFDVHALSCWSESPTAASKFGSVIVAMKIHRSSIAASHRVPGTGISSGQMGGPSGHYGKEQEVFVASTGKVRAQIWKG